MGSSSRYDHQQNDQEGGDEEEEETKLINRNSNSNNINNRQANHNGEIYHYNKDYSKHKKNQEEFMQDHKYKSNNEQLKQYLEGKKEKRINNIERGQTESVPAFPQLQGSNSTKNHNRPPLQYNNGKLSRDDQYLVDKQEKDYRFKKNQMNSKERQDKFLREFRQRQIEKKLELRYSGKKQHSHSSIPSQSDVSKMGEKYTPHINQNQNPNYIVNQAIIKQEVHRTPLRKKSRKNSFQDTLGSFKNNNTSSGFNQRIDQLSNHKKIYYDDDQDTVIQLPGHKQTVEIIRDLENQNQQKSQLKQKLNLYQVLDETKNLDPLEKERDQEGKINVSGYYKQSPYVKSFKKDQHSNKTKLQAIKDMNMNVEHLEKKLNEKQKSRFGIQYKRKNA